MQCECDWTYHGEIRCMNSAADYGDVAVSPALCMRCLYACEGERDDALNSRRSLAGISGAPGIEAHVAHLTSRKEPDDCG
jgi:hypothetical protein